MAITLIHTNETAFCNLTRIALLVDALDVDVCHQANPSGAATRLAREFLASSQPNGPR